MIRDYIRSLHSCVVRGDSASRFCLWAGLAILSLVWVAAPAQAAFVQGSFQIDIAESERLLHAMLKEDRGEITSGQLSAIQMEETCMNPSIRLIHRNRPAIMLTNTSGATSQNHMSQFRIDLQQLGYEFGHGIANGDNDLSWFDPYAGNLTVLSSKSDPGVTLSSNYGTVSSTNLNEDRSKLVLNIGGLTPGKAVIFRLDLDPNPVTTMHYPDYRHIMLGGDIGDGNGPADPALISAGFTAGQGSNQMTSYTNEIEFDGGFQEILASAGVVEGYRTQTFSQQSTSTGTVIPEPSSALLLLAGLAGLCGTRRSQRR